MEGSGRSERMDTKLLDELDKIKFINRRTSYSKRISILLKYCSLEKRKFEKWLKEEVHNGRIK